MNKEKLVKIRNKIGTVHFIWDDIIDIVDALLEESPKKKKVKIYVSCGSGENGSGFGQ